MNNYKYFIHDIQKKSFYFSTSGLVNDKLRTALWVLQFESLGSESYRFVYTNIKSIFTFFVLFEKKEKKYSILCRNLHNKNQIVHFRFKNTFKHLFNWGFLYRLNEICEFDDLTCVWSKKSSIFFKASIFNSKE